jgi:hypothetical protein
MVIYTKVNRKDGEVRYLKNNLFVKSDRVPAEVLEKFEFTDTVKYDEQPDRPRCLFCEAPATRKRLVTGLMVDMCEYHYYNRNIGTIVAQIRQLDERKKSDGNDTHPQKRRSKSIKSKVS